MYSVALSLSDLPVRSRAIRLALFRPVTDPMAKTKTLTVRFTGASAGSTLIGMSVQNRGMTIEVFEGQSRGSGRVSGEIILQGEGVGRVAPSLRKFVGRMFKTPFDLIVEVERDDVGNCAHLLDRGCLRVMEIADASAGHEATVRLEASRPHPQLQLAFIGPEGESMMAIGDELLMGRENSTGLILRSSEASRHHARIWLEKGQCWIEDLGSTNGTRVNGVEIKDVGRCRLRDGSVIHIAEIRLRVEPLDPAAPPRDVRSIAVALSSSTLDQRRPEWNALGLDNRDGLPLAQATVLPVPERLENISSEVFKVSGALDADVALLALSADAAGVARRLDMIYHLSLALGAKSPLDALARAIMERLMGALPTAARGALLLTEKDSGDDQGDLLLKAYVSPGKPAVSLTLARMAMSESKGFIFSQGSGDPDAFSIGNLNIRSAMYAPLVWQGCTLGIICVDNFYRIDAFKESDLRFLLAVAHFAALALANHRLRRELEREAAIKANLLLHFSPKVAERLTGHRGRVRLGGTRSEVTILCADIRGFTGIVRNMQPDDVVEMLNVYFSQLTPILFAFDGTVDKYVGDAILTVFGSPEPDPDQHTKAVRAALQMQAAIQALNADRARKGEVVCSMGIGIHCGEVVHGFLGSSERMEFTVIGDAVNYASLYCSGAAGDEILISPEVYERVWRGVDAEEAFIATKHEGDIRAYRVKGLRC